VIVYPALIGDYVWLDADRDGVQDPDERGIANVTLVLYTDPNGDGDPSDGTVILETVTDHNGMYTYPDLASGDYVVDVTDDYGVLTNYTLSIGPDSQGDPHGPIHLDPGEKYLSADFGYYPDPGTAVIGDFVWSDANQDGVQDDHEPGIGGVTLELLEETEPGVWTVVTTTTTYDDGYYLFMNVVTGTYKVQVAASNFDPGGPLEGYTKTSGPESKPSPTDPITVNAGDVYLDADFGYYKPGLGTIGNQVWLDEDADGLYEPGAGETGIANVSVNLIKDANDNGVWDPGERIIATTTTDGSGQYLFTGVEVDDGDGDAEYLVDVGDVYDGLRRLLKSTGPNPGQNDNSQTDPYALTVTPASPDNLTADFGYYLSSFEGLVGDFFWLDLDVVGNTLGQWDPGEPPISGVEVQLYRWQGSNWVAEGTTTTDANGKYYFTGLEVGGGGGKEYRVVVLDTNFDPGGALYGLTRTNGDGPSDTDEVSIPLTESDMEDLTLDFGYLGEPTSVDLVSLSASSGYGGLDEQSPIPLWPMVVTSGLAAAAAGVLVLWRRRGLAR